MTEPPIPFDPPPDLVDAACQEALPAAAVQGLEAFNQQRFFEAHELLEAAWRSEPRPIRELYRGILQVAVGYYHITRGNYTGALKMFARSRAWLAPFPKVCQGIQVALLGQQRDQVEVELLRLGPERIQAFNSYLFKSVDFSSSPKEG